MPVRSPPEWPIPRTAPACGVPLRFATIGVDQFSGGSWCEPDIRPILGRIACLERWANHTGGDELVETVSLVLRCRARRNELRDYATMCGDRDALSRLD